jgi:hypothetical protein
MNKKAVETYLEVEPKARLRRNKDRAIGNLICGEHGKEIELGYEAGYNQDIS